jgi:hypothetical protein
MEFCKFKPGGVKNCRFFNLKKFEVGGLVVDRQTDDDVVYQNFCVRKQVIKAVNFIGIFYKCNISL